MARIGQYSQPLGHVGLDVRKPGSIHAALGQFIVQFETKVSGSEMLSSLIPMLS